MDSAGQSLSFSSSSMAAESLETFQILANFLQSQNKLTFQAGEISGLSDRFKMAFCFVILIIN